MSSFCASIQNVRLRSQGEFWRHACHPEGPRREAASSFARLDCEKLPLPVPRPTVSLDNFAHFLVELAELFADGSGVPLQPWSSPMYTGYSDRSGTVLRGRRVCDDAPILYRISDERIGPLCQAVAGSVCFLNVLPDTVLTARARFSTGLVRGCTGLIARLHTSPHMQCEPSESSHLV